MELGMFVARDLIPTPQERESRIKLALSYLERGDKRAKVAKKLGVDPATISRWKTHAKKSARNEQP